MKYEEITVLRAATVLDSYDDPISGAFADHLVLTVKFAPNNPTEPVEVGRNAVILGGTVYARGLPAPPDVLASDRARIRGVEYLIDGEIGVWQRADTWGIQFAVKAVLDANQG